MGGSYAATADTLRVRETRITDALVASALTVPGMGGLPIRFRNGNANGGNDPVWSRCSLNRFESRSRFRSLR